MKLNGNTGTRAKERERTLPVWRRRDQVPDGIPPDIDAPYDEGPEPLAPGRTAIPDFPAHVSASPEASAPERAVSVAVLDRAAPPAYAPAPAVPEGPADFAAAPAARRKPPKNDRRRFWRGYGIYVLCLLLLIAAGLTLLWFRMDVYERSRPARAVESWMDAHSAGDWSRTMKDLGMEAGYVDSLDLSSPEYYKQLSVYTDEVPAYSISFGARPLLTVLLRPGEKLGFGSHSWELASVAPVDSGFTVYVPDDAVVAVNGVPVGQECLVQRNAQPLTLGEFENMREDIPGLSRYVLNRTFTADCVTVTAADGSELTADYSSGSSYYYPPLTTDCRILAPADAAVAVNGVRLTGANASAEPIAPETDEFKIFEGIEDYLPFPCESPARTAWTVEGLVASPSVTATLPDGTALRAEVENGVWSFPSPPAGKPDPALADELHDMIMDVFDAHIAYLGNRDKDLAANYSRYSKYLYPGAEAATQAWGAQVSLVWIHDMDTFPEAKLREVLRYDPDCFTARVEFSAASVPDGLTHTNVYIFVRYNDSWRVVRIVNE